MTRTDLTEIRRLRERMENRFSTAMGRADAILTAAPRSTALEPSVGTAQPDSAAEPRRKPVLGF